MEVHLPLAGRVVQPNALAPDDVYGSEQKSDIHWPSTCVRRWMRAFVVMGLMVKLGVDCSQSTVICLGLKGALDVVHA